MSENKVVDFKKIIEQLEYIGENIRLLFQYNSFNFNDNYERYDYKVLILINILRELFTIKEDFVINSLHSIVMKECSNKYYEEYRSYKHHPREQILRSRIKSIETKYSEFIENFKK